MSTLVLGLGVGAVFYIEHAPFQVIQIDEPCRFTLRDLRTLQDHEIVESETKEVYPRVRVSAGHKGSLETAKAVLNAPRAVEILRETLYRRKYGESSGGSNP